jgi:hypothetical protein
VQIFVISIYIKLKNRQNSFEALGNRIGDSYGEANTLRRHEGASGKLLV